MILGSVGIVAAFFVDVVTAALAILVMSRIKVEKIDRREATGSMWADY